MKGKHVISGQIITKERIETDSLTIRPYRQADRACLAELMSDPEISATFMMPDFSDDARLYEIVDELIQFSQPEDTAHLEYGIYLEDKLIGFISDCCFDDDSIELGCVIDPRCKGRGYATEATKAIINELREMGFKKVVASYFEGNIGSLKVLEKCGMHPNGRSYEEEYRGKKYKCCECEILL